MSPHRGTYSIPVLILLLTLLQYRLSSQESAINPVKFDTSYIADYKNKLTGRFYWLYQESRLSWEYPGFGDVQFKPNLNYKIGVAGFYKWFGLGLSTYSPWLKLRDDKYGETSALDLRINVYSSAFFLESYVIFVKGLFISNVTGPDGQIYSNPDLRVNSGGVNMFWVANPKRFSMRAAYLQTERQKKSAGSFVLRGTVSYSSIDSKNGMLPEDMIADLNLNPYYDPEEGNFTVIGIAPGYAYSLVIWKRFYLTGAVTAGGNVIVMNGHYLVKETHEVSANLSVTPRIALGYNSDKWFIGASAISGLLRASTFGDYLFYFDTPMFRFWVGTRFNVQKSHKKKY